MDLLNKASKKQQHTFWFILALSIFFLCIFAFLLLSYFNQQNRIKDQAFINAKNQANVITTKIDQNFSQFANIVKSIASDLDHGAISYTDITNTLFKEVATNPKFLGLGVAFKPYAFNKEKRLYAPYIIRTDDGNTKQLQVENIYDYTIPQENKPNSPNTDWYTFSISNNRAIWQEPFYGTASKDLLTTFSMPFYAPNQIHTPENQKGIVFCTISLGELDRMMAEMQVGSTGYGYIISNAGTIIAHPITKLIGTKEFSSLNKEQPKSTWHFVVPLSTTNWFIGINIDRNYFSFPAKNQVKQLSYIVLFGVIGTLLLLFLICRTYKYSKIGLWSFSIASSILFMIGILLMCYFHLTLIHPVTGIKVVDEATLNRYLTLHTPKNTIYIPTGVMVNNIYFAAVNRIGLTGYIWQEYPKDFAYKIGFTMPQQSGLTSIKLLSTRTINDKKLLVWQFDTIIRQIINPILYPIDKVNINFSLSPIDILQKIILIPDFNSYKEITSNPLIGIHHARLESYNITNSFFSYLPSLGVKAGIQNPSELNFNIVIMHNITNVAFTYLFPLFFIVGLLFVIVINENLASIIGYSGALLIILTLIQTNLRDRIAVQGISFIEIFYIVLYPMVILVSVLLLSQQIKHKEMNLLTKQIVKLAFWPTLLGLSYIFAFYFLNYL